jgi:hypothetical protein
MARRASPAAASAIIKLVVDDDVLVEAPFRASAQDVVQPLVVVLVHPDALAGTKATHEAVVDAAEQLFFLIRDADDGELWETVEVIDDARVLKLVDLVEDDDCSRAVVLLEPVNEFVVERQLAVDVDSRTEVVEDLVEGAEPSVVAPAVDVDRLDVEDFLTQAFGDELRDARLPRPAGSGDDGGVGRFPIRDGLQDTREVVDFDVAMLNSPRNEPGTENASIADHLCLID